MRAWRRVLLSLAAVVAAVVIVALASAVMPPYENFVNRLYGGVLVIGIFAVVGWVVALPLVLLVRRIEGRRVWAMAAAGSLIGPAVMGGFAVWGFWKGAADFGNGWWIFFGGALGVSGLSTLFYLLGMRQWGA